jgi:glucose-1-phosphate cytidylyltransferase
MSIPVVVLCGGSGTRLREQTEFLPKPLVQIGGKPMIHHIMKIYAHYGFTDFVLALGYKQEKFKEYFSHFDIINHDVYFSKDQLGSLHEFPLNVKDNWRVILSDTGLNTLKGARLKRVEKYIRGDTFMLAYGDSVGDIDINELLSFHNEHGKMVTVTGVRPPPRFGEIHHNRGEVISFSEKKDNKAISVNGGFYVFNRKIFDYLKEDEQCDLEYGVLEEIARMGEMMVYEHTGYWGCMDTLYDLGMLQRLWDEGNAPWLKKGGDDV